MVPSKYGVLFPPQLTSPIACFDDIPRSIASAILDHVNYIIACILLYHCHAFFILPLLTVDRMWLVAAFEHLQPQLPRQDGWAIKLWAAGALCSLYNLSCLNLILNNLYFLLSMIISHLEKVTKAYLWIQKKIVCFYCWDYYSCCVEYSTGHAFDCSRVGGRISFFGYQCLNYFTFP